MEGTNKTCSVEKCKRPHRAKGYCSIHFKKWRRGELGKTQRYKTCSNEECRKKVFKHGFCEEHFNAWVTSRKGEAPKVEKPAEAEKTETVNSEQ